MRILCSAILFLVAINYSYVFAIREGGRTVGAGAVTSIIE